MTGLGIDLADLGLDTVDVDAAPVASAKPVTGSATRDPDALVPGSPLAQALYQVWSGRSVTVVKSPPGAGKSTMICQAVTQLHKRSDLNIVVATPTRRGAFELANRLGEVIGLAQNGQQQVFMGMKANAGERLGDKVAPSGTASTLKKRVCVRTSWSVTPARSGRSCSPTRRRGPR